MKPNDSQKYLWRFCSPKMFGFTLVELLIVVAIFGILLAVALPSFQESRRLAQLTETRNRMMAMDHAMHTHLLDWGSVPADFNDSSNLAIPFRARSQTSPVCSLSSNRNFTTTGGLSFIADRGTFYALNIHCPLTSPVLYIDPAKTIDPFSDGTVPFGYDSRQVGAALVYGGFFSAGPDLVAGNWSRSSPGGPTPYTPTNGTTSRGEFWSIVSDCEFGADPQNPCQAELDMYPREKAFPPPPSDINLDDKVDALDLMIFLRDYRKVTSP